jgi:hypothetical protein
VRSVQANAHGTMLRFLYPTGIIYEVNMRRKTYRRTSLRNTRQSGQFGFLRKPVVQLSILVIAALVIFIIALAGSK